MFIIILVDQLPVVMSFIGAAIVILIKKVFMRFLVFGPEIRPSEIALLAGQRRNQKFLLLFWKEILMELELTTEKQWKETTMFKHM